LLEKQAANEKRAAAKAEEEAAKLKEKSLADNMSAAAARREQNVRVAKQIVKAAIAVIVIGAGLVFFGRIRSASKKIADGPKMLKTPINVCINGGKVFLTGWEGDMVTPVLDVKEPGDGGFATIRLPGSNKVYHITFNVNGDDQRKAREKFGDELGHIAPNSVANINVGSSMPGYGENMDFRKPTIGEILAAAFGTKKQK